MLILCGPPASGKNTVLKILKEQYDMKPIVRFSTRPLREGEIDGEDYHSTNNPTFEKMIEDGLLAEYEVFHVADDDKPWYYGSTFTEYKDDSVMICSPTGIRMLKEGPDADKIFIAELFVEETELRKRLASRDWSDEERERRLASDKKRYADMKELVDIVTPAYTSAFPPEQVAKQIFYAYKRHLEQSMSNETIER